MLRINIYTFSHCKVDRTFKNPVSQTSAEKRSSIYELLVLGSVKKISSWMVTSQFWNCRRAEWNSRRGQPSWAGTFLNYGDQSFCFWTLQIWRKKRLRFFIYLIVLLLSKIYYSKLLWRLFSCCWGFSINIQKPCEVLSQVSERSQFLFISDDIIYSLSL